MLCWMCAHNTKASWHGSGQVCPSFNISSGTNIVWGSVAINAVSVLSSNARQHLPEHLRAGWGNHIAGRSFKGGARMCAQQVMDAMCCVTTSKQD